MRKLAVVMVSVTFITGLALGGAVAGASVRRENTKFCEAVGDSGNSDTAGLDPEGAAVLAKAMRSGAKEAPKKVKRAMRKLAKFYDRIADGDNLGQVLADGAFLKSSHVYVVYFIKECTGASVPTGPPVQIQP